MSKSKDNQTVKFGELIEYNMRNIFLENSYKKFGGETSPRTIQYISGSEPSNIYIFFFILCPNQRLPKYIETN